MEEVKVMKPLGARVIVEELKSSLSLTERGKQSGLTVVAYDENLPQNTMGKILALGTDPLLHEVVKVGQVAFFSKSAGVKQYLEGRQFRILELQEILAVQEWEEVRQQHSILESSSREDSESLPPPPPESVPPSS